MPTIEERSSITTALCASSREASNSSSDTLGYALQQRQRKLPTNNRSNGKQPIPLLTQSGEAFTDHISKTFGYPASHSFNRCIPQPSPASFLPDQQTFFR